MKKNEFLKMMFRDNETESEPNKTIYADVIECMDIALSQMPDSFEVDAGKTLKDAYDLIRKCAEEKIKAMDVVPANKEEAVLKYVKTGVSQEKYQKISVGPFEAAEKVLAPYLGAKYERPSKLFVTVKPKVDVDLDDFI